MARLDNTSAQPYHKVLKMLDYIWGWIQKHMEFNCVEDATGSEQGRPAPHFMSSELIEGRHFGLQLHKEPLTNALKKFHVTWLSHLDVEIHVDLGLHSFDVMNVEEGGVMYRVILETIKDDIQVYLFSLRITRI